MKETFKKGEHFTDRKMTDVSLAHLCLLSFTISIYGLYFVHKNA